MGRAGEGSRTDVVFGNRRTQERGTAVDRSTVADEREELQLGTAGAGARRELERRKKARETKTRDDHPHIAGLLLKLQAPPQSERAWETGAAGEEEVAAHLRADCPDVLALHDRRIPGRRSNIDHIAVAPSGIYVIDAKRYKGKLEVRKLFSATRS